MGQDRNIPGRGNSVCKAWRGQRTSAERQARVAEGQRARGNDEGPEGAGPWQGVLQRKGGERHGGAGELSWLHHRARGRGVSLDK